MATINFKRIRQQVEQQASSRIIGASKGILTKRFNNAKRALKVDILEHPISQEISAGPSSSNISGTLGGKGNLYSFLGFEGASEPIETLIGYLDESIIKTEPKILSGRKYITVRTSVIMPSLKDLEDLTGFGQAAYITDEYGNRGWIYAVRHGQAGYGKYLFDTVRYFRTSRTGPAIQVKNVLRQGNMSAQPDYLDKEFKIFIKELKRDENTIFPRASN